VDNGSRASLYRGRTPTKEEESVPDSPIPVVTSEKLEAVLSKFPVDVIESTSLYQVRGSAVTALEALRPLD
jgi:hypothetical protein